MAAEGKERPKADSMYLNKRGSGTEVMVPIAKFTAADDNSSSVPPGLVFICWSPQQTLPSRLYIVQL